MLFIQMLYVITMSDAREDNLIFGHSLGVSLGKNHEDTHYFVMRPLNRWDQAKKQSTEKGKREL